MLDDGIVPPALSQDHFLVVDTEAKRANGSKCSSSDPQGALLETVNSGDCEMATEEDRAV